MEKRYHLSFEICIALFLKPKTTEKQLSLSVENYQEVWGYKFKIEIYYNGFLLDYVNSYFSLCTSQSIVHTY